MIKWLTQRVPVEEFHIDGDRYIFVPRWQVIVENCKPFLGPLLVAVACWLLVWLSR